MTYNVTVLPGDGIGPEVIAQLKGLCDTEPRGTSSS